MDKTTSIENINTTKKIINTLYELEIIDSKLIKKYKKNDKEITFYNNTLEESNNNFYIIVKNLQININ